MLQLVRLPRLHPQLTLRHLPVAKTIRTRPPRLEPVSRRRHHTAHPLAVAVDAALARRVGLGTGNLDDDAGQRGCVVVEAGEVRVGLALVEVVQVGRGCPEERAAREGVFEGDEVAAGEV